MVMVMTGVRRRCTVVTVVCVILGLVLSLLALGCSRDWGDYTLDEKSFDAKTLTMVETRTGITLPPGSRGLNFMYDGSHVDPSFIAKIEIPPAEKDTVIKQIEGMHDDKGGGVIGSLSEKAVWWNPSPSNTIVARLSASSNKIVRVYLCRENERWVLYLEWLPT